MQDNNENKLYQNLGFGLGLREKHIDDFIKQRPENVEWFEIISENYFNPLSERRGKLEKLRSDFSFVMHGVSMSIGSSDEINIDYLTKLKKLENWLQPELVSDHICWTGINNFNSHDLLPVPYTEESLKNMVKKIKQAQDFLGRRIALENPSTYLEFNGSTINEWDYIRYVAEEADCLLLLDINNVYVNCFNHNYNEQEYISAIPGERVAQIHLAGHKNFETHIVDTHSDHVNDEVLDLYEFTASKIGKRSSMIEWDAEIPDSKTILKELDKVRKIAQKTTCIEKKKDSRETKEKQLLEPDKLLDLYGYFQQTLLKPKEGQAHSKNWVKEKERITKEEQFNIYYSAYRYRLFDTISDEYKATKKYLGEENFNMLIRSYIEYSPSEFFDMNDYILNLPTFAKQYVDEITFELIGLEVAISKLGETRPVDEEEIKEFLSQDRNLIILNGSKAPVGSKIMTFNNEINKIYKACFEDSLDKLESQNIAGCETSIVLTKEKDGVYRKII